MAMIHVTHLRVTKSPGQGLDMSSPAQVPCCIGTPCGVLMSEDIRDPEARGFAEAIRTVDGIVPVVYSPNDKGVIGN